MRPDVGSYQFEETFNRYLPPCSYVKPSLSNTPLAGIRETCSINGVLALACDISPPRFAVVFLHKHPAISRANFIVARAAHTYSVFTCFSYVCLAFPGSSSPILKHCSFAGFAKDISIIVWLFHFIVGFSKNFGG